MPTLPPQLLSAVLAAPLDDAPRLAAADALAPTGADGAARADLIRVQVSRAALERRQLDNAELRQFTGRHLALTRSLVPTLDPSLRRHGLELRYDRGFAETAAGDAAAWVGAAGALRAEAPILALDLAGAERCLDALLATLDGVVSLDLSRSQIGDAGALRLAASPHVQGLRWLDLRYNALTAAGLEALAASPNLRALRWMGVSGAGFGTPTDEPIDEDGRLVDWTPTVLGQSLEQRYGPLQWLHYRPRSLRFFPPARCQFLETP